MKPKFNFVCTTHKHAKASAAKPDPTSACIIDLEATTFPRAFLATIPYLDLECALSKAASKFILIKPPKEAPISSNNSLGKPLFFDYFKLFNVTLNEIGYLSTRFAKFSCTSLFLSVYSAQKAQQKTLH